MLVLDKRVNMKSDTVLSEGDQMPVTAIRLTQNVHLSVLESTQATSSIGVVPISEKEENIIITAPVSEYPLMPQNFRKIVMQGKRFKAYLRLFTDQFEPIVMKKIKVVVHPS